jgi:hypothetical protein
MWPHSGLMPRFFFHLDNVQPVEDDDGEEFQTVKEAERHARRVAGELAKNAMAIANIGVAIIVTDDRQRELLRIPLEDY